MENDIPQDFLGENLAENPAFGHITNQQLEEQIRFSYYLREHDIPFMRIIQPSTSHPFVSFIWNDEVCRFVLSGWIEGRHITYCDENIAEVFGREARKCHDISSSFESTVFTKKSHLVDVR